MGLADRFKEKSDNINIFTSKFEEVTSNPIKKTQIVEECDSDRFADLETGIIAKIRKTPYWDEYTKKAQINMIGAYFVTKTHRNGIEYLVKEKDEFINNILLLSNNK